MKEEEEFQQIGYVNCEIDEFIFLLDVMNAVMITFLQLKTFVMSYKK